MNINKQSIRLQHFLAKCGIGSRRGCERFITEGRVGVNGVITTTLGTKVTAEDNVTFDGIPCILENKNVYLALNKPKGYLSSNYDPHGRPLAVDLFKNKFEVRLFHVGRLDLNSSGLILYTNDGDFAKKISHPSSEIAKEYLVETKYPVTKNALDKFISGVYIDKVNYTIKNYLLLNRKKIVITLIEGKNREIRKLFESIENRVTKIHRIRIGPVQLGELQSGAYRHLTKTEIDLLMGNTS